MISIIIASIDSRSFNGVGKNISDSIGVLYEIIHYDNSDDGIGICQIYNKCAQLAKFPYLLFLHDDIKFYTKDWGKSLIKILEEPKIGLVGMAGAVFKASAPTSWVSVPKEYYRSNQYFSTDECLQAKENMEEGYDEVVVVDGMFLAMRERTWKHFKFNDLLTGFHMYDIDLCYRIHKEGLLIVVPKNMVFQHFSRGKFDSNWAQASIAWHRDKDLPLYKFSVSKQEIKKLERDCRASFLAYLINKVLYPKSWLWNWIRICIKNKKVHLGILIHIFRKYKQIIISNCFL